MATTSLALNAFCNPLETVSICHARVHGLRLPEAVHLISAYAADLQGPTYVVTPNAQHIVLLDKDPYFREIYSHAGLVLPDGFSLLLAARLVGKKLRERVTGVDLFKALCRRAAEMGLKVCLLGGKPGSAELAARKLKAAFPKLTIAGTYCPVLGFERDPAQLSEIADRIRQARPHILFVGLGAPKQENWIYEHGLKLGVPVCVGIGGSFEMIGGMVPRAPHWMQVSGLEWLYRLALEPRRLWKRYLIGNFRFMAMVLRQLVYPDCYAAENAWPAAREGR